MATRTRSGNRVSVTAPEFESKSDHARFLFREGKTVAEVTHLVPDMGYAFAYGVAKRAGLNLTAANRRKARTVSVDRETKAVTVMTSVGPITVGIDGTVTRPKKA